MNALLRECQLDLQIWAVAIFTFPLFRSKPRLRTPAIASETAAIVEHCREVRNLFSGTKIAFPLTNY